MARACLVVRPSLLPEPQGGEVFRACIVPGSPANFFRPGPVVDVSCLFWLVCTKAGGHSYLSTEALAVAIPLLLTLSGPNPITESGRRRFFVFGDEECQIDSSGEGRPVTTC